MSRGILIRLFRMACVVMLLVAVAMVSAITTMHFAIHGAEVQVPTLKGMTVAEARSQAAGMGLNLDLDNRYYSSDIAAGHILSQSPAPGTVVRNRIGFKVDSPSYIDVNIPPVGAGTAPAPSTAPGSVIAQQPLAGARVDQNIIVKLVAAK
jgi:beta-lactam-binding protein with PASTA domain